MKSNTFINLRTFRTAVITMAVLLLTACWNTKPLSIEKYDKDISTDFANLKTYRWDFSALSEKEPKGGHLPEFNLVLCEHVDKHLAEMGYQRIENGNADFVLDYRIVIEQAEAADDKTIADNALSKVDEANDYSFRWHFDKRATPAMEAPKDHMTPYQRGTLHLGALNDKNQVLWHYSVSKLLNQRANEAERRAAMRIAIDKLMKEFPDRN